MGRLAAWYNTWPSHFKEVECFQQQVEPILFKYGVDMVFTGHTHAYEVSPPAPCRHAATPLFEACFKHDMPKDLVPVSSVQQAPATLAVAVSTATGITVS